MLFKIDFISSSYTNCFTRGGTVDHFIATPHVNIRGNLQNCSKQ